MKQSINASTLTCTEHGEVQFSSVLACEVLVPWPRDPPHPLVLATCKVWNEYQIYSPLASIIRAKRIFPDVNIPFGNICPSANIGSGHNEYSRIFVGGYITPPDPIYALYID
jgi:hypothetical protein